jgi:zinc D-Ala-D-Ala carboxypeptidase
MDESRVPETPRKPRKRPPLWIPVLITVVLLPIAIIRIVSSGGQPAAGDARSGVGTSAPAGPASSQPASSAAPTATATVRTTPTSDATDPLPACGVGDEPTAHPAYRDWARTLLDASFELPAGYQPPDLVSIHEAGFAETNLLIRRFVAADLSALRDAAADAGNPIDVIAAYRSFGLQQQLFQERVRQFGLAKAYAHVAAAGHSEHQLGTTLDFGLPDADDVDESFAETPAGRWLAENAYRFGFVQSYPSGESNVTCYGYEPWHYRYLGRERAEDVHGSGLTLREFLWREDHSG